MGQAREREPIGVNERPAWLNLDFLHVPPDAVIDGVTIQSLLEDLPQGVDPLHQLIDYQLSLRGIWLDDADPEEDLRKIYDLSDLPKGKTELGKAARILRAVLSGKYELHNGPKREHSKYECRGGDNFGMTVEQTYNRTKDATAVGVMAEVLAKIADWPSAGSAAWEMRRFIRRANTEQIVEFGRLVNELVERFPEKCHGGLFIDMDDLYWNGRSWIPTELENLRNRILSETSSESR